MAPFFNISFTSSFTSSSPSQITIGWKGIFDCKDFELNGIFFPFTMSKILGSYAIFIWVPTKCFDLPANGTSGILIDKNNLFIDGWTFLDSHWISFTGFKSMLNKVCCGLVTLTISLLLTPCLSVVGMRYVVVGYHYGSFSIRFLWGKSFAPHIFSVRVRG